MKDEEVGHITETAYDKTPYPNVSHSLSHPDRLATVAALLGLQPAPVERCRVLELGCAGGGNLLPMAYALPESEFVGLDLSGRQIAEGQTLVTALGLPNLTLKQMSILDVTGDLGQFDYIIAHGIYSWVPPAVQEKLLAICRQNLAANGVAYVSYNTYPGWNMLGTLRDMLLYHTRHTADPQSQTREARSFLDFLSRSISTDSNTHGSFLYVYANYIKDYFVPKEDAFLLHDELAEINQPVYFHQFVEQAAGHGLQYLGDVRFSSMLASNFPAEVVEELRQMAKTTVELEQYMDFLRNRTFRQTLLCHREVQLKPRLSPERLAQFHVASSAVPESANLDSHSVSVERFNALDGAEFATDHPLTKTALLYLTEIWPYSAPFNQLVKEAQSRLNLDHLTEGDRLREIQILGANLLKAYGYSENLVEFHVYAPRFVLEISDRPVASPVARLQAQHDHRITNLRHERLSVDTMSAILLNWLDGTHDQAELLALMEERDIIEIERQDGEPIEAQEVKVTLAELLQKKLQQFARAALLVG